MVKRRGVYTCLATSISVAPAQKLVQATCLSLWERHVAFLRLLTSDY